jgi:hypothetical protein
LPTVVVLAIPQSTHHLAEPVLRLIRSQPQHVAVMAVLESTQPEDVFALLELGATDFAVPPLRAHDFLPRLRRLQPAVSEGDSSVSQLKERLGLRQFVGESPALTGAIRLIPKLARCDASVFITGETGTGKEMFARALHYLSARSSRPFIPVNCGAIPADLVENELFGHESGAFTGATTSVCGLIHDADGGTLFLDEIDTLPLPTQVKLLRFLQDRVYRPLGSRKSRQADLRVICASNTNMEAAVRSGRFRADLSALLPSLARAVRHRCVSVERTARLGRALVARRSCAGFGLRLARGRHPRVECAAAAGLSGVDRTMSDYLANLVLRTLSTTPVVRPQLPSVFEPLAMSVQVESPSERGWEIVAEASPLAVSRARCDGGQIRHPPTRGRRGQFADPPHRHAAGAGI